MLTLAMNEVPGVIAEGADNRVERHARRSTCDPHRQDGHRRALAGFRVDRELNWIAPATVGSRSARMSSRADCDIDCGRWRRNPERTYRPPNPALSRLREAFSTNGSAVGTAGAGEGGLLAHEKRAHRAEKVTERADTRCRAHFQRTVEESFRHRAGGMAMVKIGTDETVTGGREIWRPIVRRGPPASLRTPDEAVHLLQIRLRKRGLDGVITVRNASLGYAELGIESQQRFLEPCYAFELITAGPAQSRRSRSSRRRVDHWPS